MSAHDDHSARDPVRLPAELWAAESPFVGEAADEEQVQTHPWYEGYTPFVEGRDEMYAPEAEWGSELAALEAESPLQSAFERGQTSLIEPGELEGLGRESEQETGEEGKFERDTPPAPPPTKCGFHGPNSVFVTEADLRSAVANAARQERQKWLERNSQTLQKENDDRRFGDLVRYWLAGLGGKIHPGKLEAVQQAALGPNITYGNLGDTTLNAAIGRFGVAERKVNDWIEEVYKRSAVEDSAKARFRSADAAWKTADARWKAADAAVKGAEARVRDARDQSRSAAQAELDTERTALGTATTERDAARKDRDAEKKNLDEATRARATAEKEFKGARTARKPLENPASDWNLADRQKVRKALLAKAAGTDAQNIGDIVDEALMAAHRSRADVEAWSAVFVVSCVRTAAIGRKLEAMDSGLHVGKDGLLKASRRHSDYVVEARKRKAVGGTYHAFDPRDPVQTVVQIGDIVCTDRTDFIPKPVALKDLESGRNLHCDIVTSIESENGKPVFAETIGGNVRHTVRRRRYPLDSQGRLVVSAGQLFAQEEDDGTFLPFETLDPVPTTMLAVRSTGRILALLSPVVECIKPASAPTGKGEIFLGHSLESLESPFLDEGILPTERRNEFGSSIERLADESPFVGALEERRSRFDEDQLEEEEAPDELEGGEELAAEEVWEELEGELVEEQERADADDYAFHQGDLSERGTFADHESRDPAAALEFEAAGCTGDHELLDFEGELLESEIWHDTLEQIAFRDRVLDAHIALSRTRAGAAKRDLSREERDVVAGTSIEMGLEAAAAAGRLLAAANADLVRAQAAGHADALRTIRLSATSGYRSNAEQKTLWLRYFTAKGGYYDQTQTARERLADGPHSEQAITYMLTPKKKGGKGGFGLGGRIAAPGYSNHQGGIAIDFWQVRKKKNDEILNNSGDAARAKWYSTWFHEWLRDNAAKTFGFRPIPTEEWHWEYRPGSGTTASASAATSTGPSIVTPTTPLAPNTARPAAELVRFAQRVLNAAEGERLSDDGDLGRLTRAALERFRKKYGLGMGSVLDAPTELALAQRALEELAQASMFAQPGTRDARTEQALITFKSTRGLGIDTRLDAATRRALTDALARMAPKPATTSTYLGGKLWAFESKTLPTRVAVFCPRAALSKKEVEVLVYAHGLVNGCPRPKTIPDGMITDAPFKLGDIVAASGRPIVLVVPYLDWANPGGEKAFGIRNWHALGKPAHLNSLVAEALAELGRVQSIATPSPRNLVVAGHSRAYDLLEPLAHSHSDPQMQQGALARLSQVWALDTTYAGNVSKWNSWLNANPGLQVSVFYRQDYRRGRDTGTRGDEFYAQRSSRLKVIRATEGHCAVPAERLSALLKPPVPATGQETEAPWGDDELYLDEANLEAQDYAPEPYDDATGAEVYREFYEAFEPAEEHYVVERFDPLYELDVEEQHLSAEPELDALAFEALGSDDEHVSEDEEFEFEDEDYADQALEEEASDKSPLPVPVGNPVPFAHLPSMGSFWPVRTSSKYARVVSYMYQAPSGIVGAAGRMFLAGRKGERDGRQTLRWHVGVDLFANINDVVVACEDGTIVDFSFFYKANKTGQRTYKLLIQHDGSGVVVNYGEVTGDSLSKNGLKVGGRVAAGQPIGFVSDTSMLHFETYLEGTTTSHRWWKDETTPPRQLLNPTRYLLFLCEHGFSSTRDAGTQPAPSQPAPPASTSTKPSAELVRFAQRVLNATEATRLDDDGDLGRLTRGALERFRGKYDLGAGGVLDDKTHLALAQRALEEIAQQSIFPQPGVLDPKTEQALITFKSDRGLGFGATIDAVTRAALADALARRVSVPTSAPSPVATRSGLPNLGAGLTPPTDPTAYRQFRLTTYHVVDQAGLPTGAVRVPIYDESGRKIAEGSPAFYAQLSLEGTARLTDGRLINVTGKTIRVSHDEYAAVLAYHLQAYAKSDKKRREEGKKPTPTAYSGIVVENDRVVRAFAFHEVPASRRGIGYGLLRGIPLVPFRTLAADIGHIKYQVEPKWKGKGGLVPPGTHVYIKEYDGLRLPDGTTHDGWFIVNDTGGAISGAHFDVFVGTRALRKQVKLPEFGRVWFDGIEQRIPTGYTYGL